MKSHFSYLLRKGKPDPLTILNSANSVGVTYTSLNDCVRVVLAITMNG